MHIPVLPLLLTTSLLPGPVPIEGVPTKAAVKPKPTPKSTSEAEAARRALREILDTVDAAWFGSAYQGITSVQLQGTLGIAISGTAVNQKVDTLSQGAVKGNGQGSQVNLRVKGTYFANGDFKTDLAGDFGTLLYTRRGNRGFIYSKELNAYTTRVDLPPSDAPTTYMTWFRQTLNDIRAVYIDAPTFRATVAEEDATTKRLVFDAPTSAWDGKKREQGLAQSLGFWKRGRLEVAVDKATKQPRHLEFRNDEQGMHTRMDFTYGAGNRLASVNISNSSRGFEGPGWLRIGYGGDGLMSHLAGELSSQDKNVGFALDLDWSKTRTNSDIAATVPPGAAKRGREDLETQLLIGLASKIFTLQRAGLNLRSVSLGAK
ncbi:MAG TPA: hypothetical protein VJ570_00660 [Holophagaceae bacterium]|nr:hypothetical protein [Holophagaceae bacterium]